MVLPCVHKRAVFLLESFIDSMYSSLYTYFLTSTQLNGSHSILNLPTSDLENRLGHYPSHHLTDTNWPHSRVLGILQVRSCMVLEPFSYNILALRSCKNLGKIARLEICSHILSYTVHFLALVNVIFLPSLISTWDCHMSIATVEIVEYCYS